MPEYGRDPYSPRRNDSGSAFWTVVAVLLLLVIGGFMLIGPRGHESASEPSAIASRK